MSKACKKLKTHIMEEIDSLKPHYPNIDTTIEILKSHVLDKIDFIMNDSQTTEKHGNASLTWGRRKRRMETAYTHIKSALGAIDPKNAFHDIQTEISFWLQNSDDCIASLENEHQLVQHTTMGATQ